MEKLLPWFTLKYIPGIGNHLFKRLIDRFKTPEGVFDAPADELSRIDGVSGRLAATIKGYRAPDSVKREIDQTLKKGFEVITQADAVYPPLLLEIPDPPPFLFVYGRLDTNVSNVAMVGSRNATPYGITMAERLSASLAAMGVTVVSGMALGIDTAAHRGALKTGRRTIAVLGSGLGRIYPASNRSLFHQIAENGAVVSEFSLMTEPEPHNFPIRNRVISGMSLGTVVVEATRRSGSLITARLAAEQNREVFAIPGSVQSFKSTGTHTLIKQGAKLVEHAGDIIEEVSHLMSPRGIETKTISEPERDLPPISPEEMPVFQALGPYPLHIDDLVRSLNIDPGKLSGLLLRLELKGIVRQLPGKLFVLKPGLEENRG